MSIRINYRGRIGNALFQYVYGRIIAERNEFYLSTPFPYQKLLQTTSVKPGRKYNSPKIILEEPYLTNNPMIGNAFESQKVEARLAFYKKMEDRLPAGGYLLDGYFECSEIFNSEENLIKSYFKIDESEKNTRDIVMNVRLDDFAQIGRVIDSNWYLKILEKENFNRLYIVGGTIDEPYFNAFKKFNPIIVPTDPWSDFHFLRSFDKIICSNSTYCWWAAFLSEATTIYISDKWISPLLTSCKNSTLVEAEYLPSFTSSHEYSPVSALANLKESLKVKLEKFIVPNNKQIKSFVARL